MNSWLHGSASVALRSIGITVPLVLGSSFAVVPRVPAPARDGNNPCKTTAAAVKAACKESARSDYWIRRAGCANLPTHTQRVQCAHDALDELQDAYHDCADQYAARLSVCNRLGAAGYHPVIDPANFVQVIDNPYMPLVPGTTLIYEGPADGGVEHVEFAVTHNTKVILGVTCTEVHDTSTINGELSEDTLDWFAQDNLGNVWYFGENSQSIEDGLVVSLDGSWTAGEDGALPGIVMRAQPAIGALYRQEFALGTAEDVASILSTAEALTVPYGSFSNCWKTEDFSPMEPDVLENKFFAPGIGSIREVDLDSGDYIELIDITNN